VLLDIPDFADKTKGKALDLAQCSPIDRFDCRITGTVCGDVKLDHVPP
jgi:malate/lactate dehydrogenase